MPTQTPIAGIGPAAETMLDHLSASSAARRVPPQPAPAAPPSWLGTGDRLTIDDVVLTGPLTYFGRARDRHAYPRNNALIDPGLPIAATGDPRGETLRYLSSYDELTAEARRTYLNWLAAGRPAGMPMGYVFLYFFGLERRLVYDRSMDDAPAILAELRRLLALYGSHLAFRRHASILIDLTGILIGEARPPFHPAVRDYYKDQMPLNVRVRLGELAADGGLIDADTALSWIMSNPDVVPRTSAMRCFDEFRALWSVLFERAFPQGLKVQPPAPRIAYNYLAAGGYAQKFSFPELPDGGAIAAPTARLSALLTTCTELLAPFSRHIGKNPAARGTLQATALLPRTLIERGFGQPVAKARAALLNAAGGEPHRRLRLDAVMATIGLEWPAGQVLLPLAAQHDLAVRLDALDIGFEPDRRYGSSARLTADTRIALFVAERGGPVDPANPAYAAARTRSETLVLAARAGGRHNATACDKISDELANDSEPSAIERARLSAQLRHLFEDPPKPAAVLKRLQGLPNEHRQRIAAEVTAAVIAAGTILPAEVRFLEHVHDAAGLRRDDVYGLLHRQAGTTDAPIAITSGGAIDPRRLARIRGETADVSALLASIFAEDEPDPPACPAIEAAPRTSAFPGLDAAHATLLARLLSAPMARPAFEEAARALRLMPAGAVETINGWGFDTFDEAVIDENDMVLVPDHVVERLDAARGAA